MIGNPALDKWQYIKKEGTNPWETEWTDISVTATSLSYTVTGLTNSTNYQFKVRGVNSKTSPEDFGGGTGAASDASTATQPAAPSLAASNVEAATATLTISNYAPNWYYKYTSPSGGQCSAAQTTSAVNLTGLATGTSHTFKAYSDSGCSTELATATAFLTKPGQVSNLVADGRSRALAVSWDAETGADYGYHVQWKSGNQNWSPDRRALPQTNSHSIPSLVNGTQYSVRVHAINATGDGAWSTTATGTPNEPQLTVVNFTTLNMANYGGTWYYKYTSPDGGTCSTGQTGKTATPSLSQNTNYTFAAYSNSTCTTLLDAARSFLSLPGKVSWDAIRPGEHIIEAGWHRLSGITEYRFQWKCGTEDWYDDGASLNECRLNKNAGREVRDCSLKQNQSRHIAENLASDVPCSVRVAGKNTSGYGEWSDVRTATPSGTTFTASNIKATTVTMTVGNNVSNSWNYKQLTPTVGSCTSGGRGNADSINVTGLEAGTAYKFRAYSGSIGCGTVMATSATFLTAPPKVTGLSVTELDGKLALSWTAQKSATSYKIQWKSGTQDWDATNRQTTATTLSKDISLTNATQYTIRVAAANADATGAWSNTATGTPSGEALRVSSITTTGATLTIGNYNSTWYYKHTTPSTGTCSSAVSGLTTTVGGLTANTSYVFKAYSDSTCSTELATATTFPTLPPKPATPTATAGAGSGKLTIASSVTGDANLVRWEYKKKTTGNFDANWTQVTGTSRTLSHTVSNLTDSTNYQFKVQAVNASGSGAESDASTAVAPVDETLTASSVEATTATLTIANYSGNWYYKHTVPSSGTCSTTAVSTSTVDLADLSGNTSYTFKAYSDSSCSTELAAASAFLTKPGKPTGVSAAKDVGSGKLTLAATVTGDGDITGWEYLQKEGTNDFGTTWTEISSTSKTLSHTISSLTDGTNYQFQVRAVNATGDGLTSDASDAVAPAAPTLASSSVEATTATLTIGKWTGDWYYKYTAPTGGTCSSSAVTGLTEDLDSLASNTSYTFKAYSDSSCSTELATASAFLTKPGKPAKPVASVGAGTGKLILTSSVTGDGTLTEWEYQQKSDGSFGSWQDISSTSTSLSHTVSSLTDGTSYQFKVRAVNATGTGAASDASDAKSPAGITLTATEVSASGAKLTIGNYDAAWWYEGDQSGATCTSVDAGTASATLSNLDAGTSYVYKAYSATGCNSTDLIATASSFLTLPAKPTGVAVTTLSTKLKVSWTAVTSATSYKVQWKSGNQNYNTGNRQATVSNGTAHTITGLTNSTAYTIRVTATNGTGDGAPSTEVTGTPAAVTLAASEVSASGATLTIGNHIDAWWYEGDQSGATCTSVSAGTLTATLSSLDAGTSYVYKAYSATGCDDDLIATAASFLTKPGQVSGVTAAARDESLAVSWTAVTSATSYKIQWKSGNQEWDASNRQTTSTTTSKTLTSLTNATEYTVRVAAVNGTGDGAWSDDATGTPSGETLTVSSITATGATLTIANHGGDWYYKHTTPSSGQCSSAVSGASTTVSNLDSGTTYTFKAYSNSGCSTLVATASDFITKPGKVAGVAAAARDEALAVTWTATTGAASYKIQWKSGNQEWDASNRQTTSTTASKTLTSLTNSTQYTVRVAAVNTSGDGAWSDTATGTPAGGDADRERHQRNRCDADCRQLRRRLVLQAHNAQQRAVLVEGVGPRHDGERPEFRHHLHLQGVQQQRLLDAAGDRLGLHHQAGEGVRRGGGGPRRVAGGELDGRDRGGELQDPVEVRQRELRHNAADHVDHDLEDTHLAHQQHGVHGAGGGSERERRRGLVGYGDGDPGRRDADGERHQRNRRDAHDRQLRGRLVLQAHNAQQRAVLVEGVRLVHDGGQSGFRHDLHLQGVQQQRLLYLAGDGRELHHQAGQGRGCRCGGARRGAGGVVDGDDGGGELQDSVEVRCPELGRDEPADDVDDGLEDARLAHQRDGVHGARGGGEHQRRRRVVEHGNGDAGRRDADGERHQRNRCDAHHRQLRGRLVLQAHDAG